MSERTTGNDDVAAISTRRRIPSNELMTYQGQALAAIWDELHRTSAQQSGPAYVRYWELSEDVIDVEVGVPIAVAPSVPTKLLGSLPGGDHIVIRHLGEHSTLGESYQRLAAATRDADSAGPPWEVYEWIPQHVKPDPASWPAPTQWTTLLVQPLTTTQTRS